MSESNSFKKEVETDELSLFLIQHEHVTGMSTQILSRRERPDFEVLREGRVFGLELVKVVDSPRDRFWNALLIGSDKMSVSDASDRIQEAIYDKDRKRASCGWEFPNSTILVVQVIGADIQDVMRYWDETILHEVRATGFSEIWLSDHSPIEPFGTVEIIGIKTGEWAGLHRHSAFGTKPYG